MLYLFLKKQNKKNCIL